MGGKQRWTADEEQALRDGVDRYGPGKWRTIQKDLEFAQRLNQRSNVDLKDKWRNLTSDPSQESAAKNRSQHGGASASKRGRGAKRGAASRGAAKRAAPGTPRRRGAMEAAAAAAVLMGGAGGDGPSHSHSAGPATGPKVEDMIIAAVISLCESRGSHADDIQDWIESQYSVARGFGRVLGPTLQHMVDTGRLEAGPPPEPRYRLATLKYAAGGGDAGDAGSPLQSSLQSSDMRGAFDQPSLQSRDMRGAFGQVHRPTLEKNKGSCGVTLW